VTARPTTIKEIDHFPLHPGREPFTSTESIHKQDYRGYQLEWAYRQAKSACQIISQKAGILGFGVSTKELSSDIRVPCWFPVLLASMTGITPWIRWSRGFSLRTLLIVTTLVAAVLALAVWAASR
jgi:hypothetical protein